MADVDVDVDVDLEDGEIESDSEQQQEAAAPPQDAPNEATPAAEQVAVVDPKKEIVDKANKKSPTHERRSPKKSEKSERKKSKDYHKRQNDYRAEKSRHYPVDPIEEDFAGSIEKAIKKELKKIKDIPGSNDNADSGVEDSDGKRKHKKRKKHDYPDKEPGSKKRKTDESPSVEEMDEDEMMCIRGASPVHRERRRTEDNPPSEDDYGSDRSDDSNRSFDQGRDRNRDNRNRNFPRRGTGGRDIRNDRFVHRYDRNWQDKHPLQDPDGVCLFYMQGKCYKGDNCAYSHDARPPRKMELCKFYLMDCCAKKDKCLYLHSDFPCKYYHTGLPCPTKDNCKFAHGKPLTEALKQIILKHIESAPKEILGDFPRFTRENASVMLTNTQNRLKVKYGEKVDPSTTEQPITGEGASDQSQDDSGAKAKTRKNKVRQSRWRDPSPVRPSLPSAAENILSVQNLNGVLTANQISDLVNMGITSLNQLGQLTVIQLNQLGITVNQINEIQLNTMNIQKLGLIDNKAAPTPNLIQLNKIKLNSDMDMRVSPGLPDTAAASMSGKQSDSTGKDIDMRFQNSDKDERSESIKRKNSLDFDQYTKDALMFGNSNHNANLNSIPDKMSEISVKPETSLKTESDLDVDHRVLNYVREASVANVKLVDEDTLPVIEADTDTRLNSLPKQEIFLHTKNDERERVRRPTTDDEEDNLQIDEKWYSSDEEQGEKHSNKIKSPSHDEKDQGNSSSSHVTEASTVIKSLGDLSKIDISDEVTKLLTSIKSSTSSENPANSKKDYLKSRDPRNLPKPASENKEASTGTSKQISHKPEFVSIYNCIDNPISDASRNADVDLRTPKDVDFRMSSFGDTDLRQTPGGSDVDLRLGLPLKLLPNYTPATEIDGSIGSHPPMTYKVYAIDIPRPDYTNIKNSTPQSQAHGDPRLRKIFRLSLDESPSDTEKPSKSEKPAPPVRSDPRKRTTETNESNLLPKPATLDIQIVVQTSEWYKNLSSNQKILTNQQIATVTSNLKKFHADKTVGKKFDLAEVKANNMLCMIFGNLGVFLDENGEFFRINSQDNMIPPMQPNNFNMNPDMFMNNVNNMGMNPNFVNMGPIGNMGHNMLPQNNFDPRFSSIDPRGPPSIMGMPPNIQNNFDNNLGMQNYDSENYDDMNYDNAYDDPENNGNDYMNDMDDNYYRDHKNDYKNHYRSGRNNERWNRGGRSRGGNNSNNVGNRDRRGYTERGNWKNDRR